MGAGIVSDFYEPERVASTKLARDLGITQKTAWHMMHRIREAFQDPEPMLLDGVVEIDKTYISGLEANKHWARNYRQDGEQPANPR